jgi:undecaprenyl-diphosphatase
MIVGFLLRNIGMEMFRQPEVIGWTILIYGVILYIADRRPNVSKTTADLGLKDALWIGLAHCLALIPGTSRSGITITMARFLGVSRTEAAKFSMLLSVPTIFAAGLAEAWNLYRTDEIDTLTNGTEAAFYSFLASVLVITLMMKWLKTATYLPFVIYRIVLGGFLIGQAFF